MKMHRLHQVAFASIVAISNVRAGNAYGDSELLRGWNSNAKANTKYKRSLDGIFPTDPQPSNTGVTIAEKSGVTPAIVGGEDVAPGEFGVSFFMFCSNTKPAFKTFIPPISYVLVFCLAEWMRWISRGPQCGKFLHCGVVPFRLLKASSSKSHEIRYSVQHIASMKRPAPTLSRSGCTRSSWMEMMIFT
jgi:hypothetical protein